MKVNYKTKGTCATSISFEIEDGKLHNIEFTGGCNGNLKAISKLCEGRPAEEVANILAGNTCGFKSTSCADQFSKAILSAAAEA
ncbi:uncharacterized protein TIGR03905 [Lachnospiraceae bacterium KH1T2]|nr:uncharacterized protein TIGR03905 [Lachnospiraceae bacterium KH1T2]